MSDSNDDSLLKQYGLEFIKDLAKDRKNATLSLGVSFKGMKNDLLTRSNIISRKEDRDYVENLLKSFDDEVKRAIESQLTRITIKSFNWIKEILIQDKRIVIEKKDEELVNELQQKLKDQTNEVSRLNHLNDSLENQLKTKEGEYDLIDKKFSELQKESQEQLLAEKAKSENLDMQLSDAQNKVSSLEELSYKLSEDNKTLEEGNTSLKMELVEKTAEVTRLNETITKQAAEAMETWASAYTEQQEVLQKSIEEQQEEQKKVEDEYQRRLQEVKQGYEETMKQRILEDSQKYEEEIDSLREKLTEEEDKRSDETKELNAQIREITSQKDFLEGRNERLENQVSELLESSKQQSEEITENRIKLDKLQADLEEEREKSKQAQAAQQIEKVQSINEYIEQVLSLSNFAPITILVRMGEMSLKALAQSVGMDPIVLENQLQPLNQHDLIDIRTDGKVRAKLPPSSIKERKFI